MTIGDDGDDIFKSGVGVKIIVTIVIIVTATGSPKSRKTFWGEEAQWNERTLALCAGASDMELVPTIRRGAGCPLQRAALPGSCPQTTGQSPRHFAALGLKVS